VGLVGKLTGGPALAVHRLDEGTSGLMMVARNLDAQHHLKAQLEVHSVERRYVAMVLGHSDRDKWIVANHLMQIRSDGLRGSVEGKPHRDARYAKTMFTKLGRAGKRVSIVEAVLETGRTHQVRIHLSEGGTPIVGDPKYGTAASARLADRVCLHAVVLGIEHPRSGERMRFTSPLPDDMERLRRRLIRGPQKPERAKGPPRKKGKKSKKKRTGKTGKRKA
jgi:23S rRNA pseudouridine1911/1915/1917 synthase